MVATRLAPTTASAPSRLQTSLSPQFSVDNSSRASSSVSVHPDCISAFNDLKLGKETKYIIYKISDDWKEVTPLFHHQNILEAIKVLLEELETHYDGQIVVEETSKEADFGAFREKLLNAKSKDRRGKEGMGGRYAVYDVEYDAEGGEGKRYIIAGPFALELMLTDKLTEARSPSSHGSLMTRHNT